MAPFWRFVRFAGTFFGIIVVALSLFWVAGAADLTAVALRAFPW